MNIMGCIYKKKKKVFPFPIPVLKIIQMHRMNNLPSQIFFSFFFQ